MWCRVDATEGGNEWAGRGTVTYEVRLPDRDTPRFAVTVTLPAGWSGDDEWLLRRSGGVDSREGVAITLWGAPAFVYGDPCRWADSAIEVEPTVDFMAEALAAQATRDASTPREFVSGEHRGMELEMSVPDDVDTRGVTSTTARRTSRAGRQQTARLLATTKAPGNKTGFVWWMSTASC
jgi:hypothetical protein